MKNKKLLLTVLPLFALASCGKIQSKETIGEIQDQSLANLFERLTSITVTETEKQYSVDLYPDNVESYSFVEKSTKQFDRKNHIAKSDYEEREFYKFKSGYESSKGQFIHEYLSFVENEEHPDSIFLEADYESSLNADEPAATMYGHTIETEFEKDALNDKNEILFLFLAYNLGEFANDINFIGENGLDKDYVSHYEWCELMKNYYYDLNGYCLSTYDIYFEKINKNDGFAMTKIVTNNKYYIYENLDGELLENPILSEDNEVVTELGYDEITLEVKTFEDKKNASFPVVGVFDEGNLEQLVDAFEFELEVTDIYKDIHNDGSNIRVYTADAHFSEGDLFTFFVVIDDEFEVLGSDYYHFDSSEFEKAEGSSNVIKCLKSGVYNITAITDASTNKLLEVEIKPTGFPVY